MPEIVELQEKPLKSQASSVSGVVMQPTILKIAPSQPVYPTLMISVRGVAEWDTKRRDVIQDPPVTIVLCVMKSIGAMTAQGR